MGDQEAEHTEPHTQLEEITSKIADLNKWREIFGFHGLEISNTARQHSEGSLGDGTSGAGDPVGPRPVPPSAIPRALLLSPATGGRPISLEMAMGLRKLLFGNVFHLFSCGWAKAYFKFREPYSDLAYALEAENGGARAILMAVQAHIIKYLLFIRNTEYCHLERLSRLCRREQAEALAVALAEVLWAAGGGRRAVVCLIAAALHVLPSGDYKADNFTERIQLFEFCEKAAAQEFISDHIKCFKGEGSHGVILFLYSLLFSRTLERVQEDLDGTVTPLLQFSCGNITCTQAVLSLLLTGRANPRDIDGGQERECGHGATHARRWPVGYLRWDRAQVEGQVCRGLGTPQLPVWLCSLSGRHSVLFSTDSLLLSDWKRERAFRLYFYSGQREQAETAPLTIDTHSHPWEQDRCEEPGSPRKRRPPIEMAIRTKWAGATVSWNGTDPFF